MNKKILIITTGGTIAMRYEKDKGIVPAEDLVDFLKSFPQISNVADVEVFEFSNIPSPYMTPEKMFELAQVVDLKSIDFDGVVITHGTDTVEETAYLLDLVLNTKKAVVLTAAMRSGGDLGLDGPRNIVGAVRVASHPESVDKGVLVVMNDEIHTARDVVKADTGKLDSFVSLGYGILGIVDSDKIIYHRSTLYNEKIWTDKLETNIDLIKATVGMDSRYIDNSVEHGAKAIIIEAFGRGNLPDTVVPALINAIEKGVLIIITSRAYTGRVLPEYGYEGGGLDLKNIGCILAGDLRGVKARIKMMVLFGKYKSSEIVRKFFLSTVE